MASSTGIIPALNTQRKLEVVATSDRLESWKEIAAYLRRSERTVRRWESTEGLPVHRLQHDKRGSVYAYTQELDRWRQARRHIAEEEASPLASARTLQATTWRWAGAAIALGILASGGVWLAGRPTTSAPPSNPEAVRLVERASAFASNPGRVQIETAMRTYQEALRLDPGYARAWSGLATTHLALLWFGETSAAELIGQARKEAEEARRLDPSLGAPWRVLAFASHFFDFNHSMAEAQFRKAIELDPNDAVALSWYGDFLTDLRRFDEARRSYVRAQEARPTWLEPITFAANLNYFAGHPDLAIADYKRVLEIQPSFGFANHFLGRAHLAAGRTDTAVAQLRKSDELLGSVPFSRADLGYALARAGHASEAETLMAEMRRKESQGYYPAFSIALVSLGLGRTDEALDWLEKAIEEKNVGFYLPSVDPLYDPIRTHPRFRRVLERINVVL